VGDSPLTPFAADVGEEGIWFVEIVDADAAPMSDFKRRYDELLRNNEEVIA
jgi:hypothetical protein